MLHATPARSEDLPHLSGIKTIQANADIQELLASEDLLHLSVFQAFQTTSSLARLKMWEILPHSLGIKT